MRVAKRVTDLPPYLFAELERKISERRAAGIDVISLGIGDPDLPTPAHRGGRGPAPGGAARHPSVPVQPRPGACSARRWPRFYQRRFGVELDPDTEILPLLGGKEGVAHVCWSMLDPGDVCLAADPGYPVYTGSTMLAGGEPVLMPLLAENGFQPDLESIPRRRRRPRQPAVLQLPEQPDRSGDRGRLLRPADAFGLDRGVPIVHDNAYSELTFDGYVAPSFLETPGAKDAGIEMFSLSKAYNMTGWRVGAAVGNAEMIAALWQLKTNIDSGMFDAIQMAARADARRPQDFVAEMRQIYRRRRDLVIYALAAVGIDVPPPKGTIYIWVPVPRATHRCRSPSWCSTRPRSWFRRVRPTARTARATCGSR